MELWYALVDLLPFDWAQPGSMYFMKNALLAVLVISPLFGVLSTMVVHSRMSFFSDALGHSAFTGMAIGAICGFNEPTWALIIFPIILIAEVTVLRKWCSKICPISALVSLLSNLNVTLRPRVKADAFVRSRGVYCHACVDACPAQLDPHSRRIPACSKCGKCVEACPAKAIGIKLLK